MIEGTLSAVGSAASPIRFHGETETPGAWSSIYILGAPGAINTGSVIADAAIEYGGSPLSTGLITLRYAEATIERCSLGHSLHDGVYVDAGSSVSMSDCALEGNAGFGVYIRAARDSLFANLTASANGHDTIGVYTSVLEGDHVWEAAGIPYQLRGTAVVGPADSLVIREGNTVLFDAGVGLVAKGLFAIEGAPEARVLLTSSAPEASRWRGLEISGTAEAPNLGSFIHFATIEHGGVSGIVDANVWCSHADLSLRDSLLAHGAKHGLRLSNDADATVRNVDFEGNAGSAVYLITGADPSLMNLAATGNGFDGVEFNYGAIRGNHVWENSGIPYEVTYPATVAPDSSLKIEAGATVYFAATALDCEGQLFCCGTESQPVLLSSRTGVAGAWGGVRIRGSAAARNSGSRLSHTVIEYGGSTTAGGNLILSYAQAALSQCRIRYSERHGLRGNHASGSVVERSRFEGNAEGGVYETGSGLIIAPNNWWGDSSGPYHADMNPAGVGESATGDVLINPWLTGPDQDPGPAAPVDAMRCEMQPRRWYVPADGQTKLWIDVTVRDSAGEPLPGRSVSLVSSLGTVGPTGVTDVHGRLPAYVTSSVAGDCIVTASVVTSEGEYVLLPEAEAVFTDSASETAALFPEAEAPYVTGGLEFDPLPIMRGSPVTIRALATNPNDFDVLISAQFEVVQYGIGLAFGPVGEVYDQHFAAHETAAIETVWTPSVEGHQCIRMIPSWSIPSTSPTSAAAKSQRELEWLDGEQQNVDVQPPRMADVGKTESIDKAEKATKVVSKLATARVAPMVASNKTAGMGLSQMYEVSRGISKGLQGEPPRLDYDAFSVPAKPDLPRFSAGGGDSAARLNAINSLYGSMESFIYFGRAAMTSYDRFGGASAAGDLYWASQQAAAMAYFSEETGYAAQAAADRLNALTSVMQSEGEPDVIVTVEEVRAVQARWNTEGLDADEQAFAALLNLRPEEIEEMLLIACAADPREQTGSVYASFREIADAFRAMGDSLTHQRSFAEVDASSSSTGRTSLAGNNLVEVGDTACVIPVSNPTTASATIEMRLRRLNMPLDWMASVVPRTLQLEPGELTTVTLTLTPGIACVQGTMPTVALEGWTDDGVLIGGVMHRLMIPEYAEFTPGETLAAQVRDYLLGRHDDPERLDLNVDGRVDAADLVGAAAGGP